MITLSSPETGLDWLRQRLTSIGAASCSLAVLSATPVFTEDLSFKDFPYLIYCEVQGVDHAFYFSRLDANGVAVYLSPGRQAGIITIDGAARRVGDGQSGTCANKTLDDLRTSGQAYDLSK
ncbi:hypothetical protein EET67_21395 [Pseudaminobacter arsenicus]|uniref:Uncharacterized protein n=1 Tax=Borborobacter arsenicus TaxID=1851146 RepID=A0A432V0S0_9HYPH|nr:hypothetical protein [Pseudaminobacter arsenicus]RUM95761.1 hypothetical protein EET67_21395 [Pseudaminobacter arsenicus]